MSCGSCGPKYWVSLEDPYSSEARNPSTVPEEAARRKEFSAEVGLLVIRLAVNGAMDSDDPLPEWGYVATERATLGSAILFSQITSSVLNGPQLRRFRFSDDCRPAMSFGDWKACVKRQQTPRSADHVT